MSTKVLLIMSLISLLSCQSTKELKTVTEVDISKYAGKWYEIARLPNRFEKGMICVTANYSIREDGKIEVINQGHSEENPTEVKKAKGVAWVPDSTEPGRLKVSFFRPFYGRYYIIALDKDYKYALVGNPSREYLWILARTKSLDSSIYNELLNTAKQNGFAIEKLIKIDQSCE